MKPSMLLASAAGLAMLVAGGAAHAISTNAAGPNPAYDGGKVPANPAITDTPVPNAVPANRAPSGTTASGTTASGTGATGVYSKQQPYGGMGAAAERVMPPAGSTEGSTDTTAGSSGTAGSDTSNATQGTGLSNSQGSTAAGADRFRENSAQQPSDTRTRGNIDQNSANPSSAQ